MVTHLKASLPQTTEKTQYVIGDDKKAKQSHLSHLNTSGGTCVNLQWSVTQRDVEYRACYTSYKNQDLCKEH